MQDLFLTETAKQADVFLPACSFVERDGHFTNIEGRVQRFKAAFEPIGESRPDWHILAELLARYGKPVAYFDAVDISDEIDVALLPHAGGNIVKQN